MSATDKRQYEKIWTDDVTPIPWFQNYLEDIGRDRFSPVWVASGKHYTRTSNPIKDFWPKIMKLRDSQFLVPFFAGMYEIARDQIQSSISRAMEWDISHLTPFANEIVMRRRNDLQNCTKW